MSPTAQTTPHVTKPSQATNPTPAVTPPSHKPKRSLGDDEGDNTGRKAAGKAQKDNNSSMMEGVEITKEPGPQGNDKAEGGEFAEATTTSRRDNAEEKEEE